jgi:hypothetical protein
MSPASHHVRPASQSARHRAGAVADAIGHCVLVFVFVPLLPVVWQWLRFEATNPLDLRDPLVLAFLPVRGGNVALDAFYGGLLPGVLTGVIAGILLSVWLGSGARIPTRWKLHLAGAAAGAVAACVMVAVVAGGELVAGRERKWGVAAVAFEVGSGLVCGTIAVPSVARLLGRHDDD